VVVKNQENNMESTERDILIEVKTKVEFLTTNVKALSDKLDANSNAYDALQSRVDAMSPKVEELNNFKNWFYTSIIGSGLTIILFVINFFNK